MKSLLVSALAVGTTLGQTQSAYYIGNYTALGSVNIVPYPLDECVGTGFPAPFAVFECNTTTNMITIEQYSESDPTCEGSYTEYTIQPGSTPAVAGYAHCNGPESYMVIDQFVGSCSGWETGQVGTTVTTIATEACTLYNATSPFGVPLYTSTSCNSAGQVTYLYAGDPTCSPGHLIGSIPTSAGCHYYTKQGSLSVYSAMRECVYYGTPQRCSNPLVSFTAVVKLVGLDYQENNLEIFSDLFEFATVSVMNLTNMSNGDVDYIQLSLGFCSVWEDQYYAALVKNLGSTIMMADEYDVDAICWWCTNYNCTNSTYCGKDNYCVMSEKCVNETVSTSTMTATTSGSVAISITIFTLIALLLSFVVY